MKTDDENETPTEVFVLTVSDIIVQIRDYVVVAQDEDEAFARVKDGLFLIEGEPATVDHEGESRLVACIKIGEIHAESQAKPE